MADTPPPPPRSPTTDFYGILGIQKGVPIKEMCRAYKSLFMKWHPDNKSPSIKAEAAEAKFQEINESYEAGNENEAKEKPCGDDESPIPTPPRYNKHHHRSMDESFFPRPAVILGSLSKKNRTLRIPTPSPPSSSKSVSQTSSPEGSWSKSTRQRTTTFETEISSPSPSATSPLSGSISRRSPTHSPTPIVYSQSTARRKPPPIETKLECTLEELCDGCVKQIKITRDVIRNGIIDQEEETVKIIVKPGWRKGTKITFEGKGEEKPGYYPADVIFLIDEKRHHLFERQGDDLEYVAGIPLVEALTGCSISVPLLGGEYMSLSFNEIIHPGYTKVIRGQGMPIINQEGRRGDLRIAFLIDFPTELSHEQRLLASNILQDCS